MTNPMTSTEASATIESFHRRMIHAWPLPVWAEHGVLVGVSGGPDSVALIRALAGVATQSFGSLSRLAIAHVHHDVRGNDADHDQVFVESLGKELGVTVYVRRLDGSLLKADVRDGFESAARTARYAVLAEIAHDLGCRYLATGHNLDDQAETVLFRVLRGSGVSGLASIRRQRRIDEGLTLVRPLLGMTRSEIDAYLAALDQPSCVDRSNFDPDAATRNWIRHVLLPQIRERMGDRVNRSLAQLAETADEQNRLMNKWVDPIFDRAVTIGSEHRVTVDCEALRQLPSAMIHAILQRIWWRMTWPQQAMSNQKWRQLAALISSSSDDSPTILPGVIRARRLGTKMHLERQTG